MTTPTMPDKPTTLPDGMCTEDSRLIEQVARGNRQAFGTLYQRYLPRLSGYLQHRLDQPELVEEVCQDVFLIVWQQAPYFRGKSQVSTWLLGIARRQALKILAAHQRPDPPLESITLSAPSTPEASLSTRERLHTLRRALVTLPASQRHLIEMVYFQDRPYGEIAACLGCSITTVKTRLRHARRQLGTYLVRADQPLVARKARDACSHAVGAAPRGIETM